MSGAQMCPLNPGIVSVAHFGGLENTGFSLFQFFMSVDDQVPIPFPVQKI